MSTKDAAPQISLVATLPQGALLATSLGIEGLGWHRSPGSAKYFQGRSVFLDLPHADGKASFNFQPEGEWRDAAADTAKALKSAEGGKKTKTALSNNVLHCVPIDAPKRCYLVKTSGRALELKGPSEIMKFTNHGCDESLSPDEIAKRIGEPPVKERVARYYMTLAPLEMLVLSNLTPAEYAWYATHRPGKIFRTVCFTEVVGIEQRQLVAESVLTDSVKELHAKTKKTKTLASGNLLNRVPFQDWEGYADPNEGGLFFADREHIVAWRFPSPIPSQWVRSEG